jgi:hypothetical protein
MLCFGPGNTDFIGQLNYMQNQKNKQMAWQLPIVQVIQDGKPTPLQVFEGCLGTEIAQWASRAMDRVKQDLGQPKLDKIYRVNVNGAEDITQAVKAEEKEAAAS